jgi:hypothetical protein
MVLFCCHWILCILEAITPPLVLFGDNAIEVANHAILPMCPIVYHGYRKHVTLVFW